MLGTDYIQAANGWAGMDGDPNPFTSSLSGFNKWTSGCSGGHVDQLTLAVPIIPKQNNSPVITLQQGATSFSSYSQYFVDLTDNLVKYAQTENAYLRLGWEFDNNHYAWLAQTPQNESYYATYFADIVSTMRTEEQNLCTNSGGATCPNYKFIWDPDGYAYFGLYNSDQGVKDNVDNNYNNGCSSTDYPADYNSTDPSLSCLLYAWPGSQYVDYIGQDLYDQQGWDSSVPGGPTQQGFANYIQPQLNEAEALSLGNNDVPLTFPEWGVCKNEGSVYPATLTCQGDDVAYIDGMYNFMANPSSTNPNDTIPVAWESYFNSSETGWNSQITGSQFTSSLAAFQTDFG